MRVSVSWRGRSFHYRLRLHRDDGREGKRRFRHRSGRIRLENLEYRMDMPEVFSTIHPDVHAMAIWLVVRPFVGSRLDLPFVVSESLAKWMLATHGVRLAPASARQRPRRPPRKVVPTLLFSGGADSMAASLLLPPGTHHLFLDRMADLRPWRRRDALLDLVRQRRACRIVEGNGRPVHIVRDGHEHLLEPYPVWHDHMEILPALYLADSLGLGAIDAGDVSDAIFFGGYHEGNVGRWKMRPLADQLAELGGIERLREQYCDFLGRIGLRRTCSIVGLSEVGTSIVLSRGPYRDQAFSCYYRSRGSYCMRCDKCFKKLLLRHIADGEEVPRDLFERFLRIPYLGAIFQRPYFDWHNIWYYVFQRMRCRHWFAEELHRQAREGPDLSCLEKWYPRVRPLLEPSYEDLVLSNVRRYVGTMTAAEVKRFETLDVPPLYAPPLGGSASGEEG